jgi:MscS family membrane protein
MRKSEGRAKSVVSAATISLLLFLFCPALWAQIPAPKPATEEAQPEVPKDTLGRNTPRGTVLGFLGAARKDNNQVAALYLNTPKRGPDSETLAHELAVVLDRRLPAQLNKLSDQPEGSLPNPLKPDEDLVGIISTADGDLDILVERVDRGKAGQVWLFSRTTLDSIPKVFQELSTPPIESLLPGFLVNTRLATVPLFEWLAFFVGIPLLYFLTGLLNRLSTLGFDALGRRLFRNPNLHIHQVLPPPVRILLLAVTLRWTLSKVGLSLLARQFWATTTLVIAIAAGVWLLMLVNRWGEHYLLNHRRNRDLSGSTSVLRLVRRAVDGLVLFAALLFTLYHFGLNPTAALAGLGVGGIAVALAAQKTLENVIGGISLIADEAVRVGDTLKLGDISGTVEDVGLRSTRIRTLDRTLISVPNGQIATMSIETLSARDMFWFHPVVGLRYETTSAQLGSVIAGVRKLLIEHSSVDSASVRVRFLRLGASSLDVDTFAYVVAPDWNAFMAIQEELLFGIVNIVHQSGTDIAFPSQTLYLATDASDKLTQLTPARGKRRGTDAFHQESDVH